MKEKGVNTNLPELADEIAAGIDGTRRIVGIIGPPGAGKSTLAEELLKRVTEKGVKAEIIPMDGFHLDDPILVERGLRLRRGSPDSFDAVGFVHLMRRLRANEEPEIAIPVFDRETETSRAGARMIGQGVDLLLVEGNYLLLDRPPWSDLAGLFDLTIALEVPEAELRARLRKRWRDLGERESVVEAKIEGNDMKNALIVMTESRPADRIMPFMRKVEGRVH